MGTVVAVESGGTVAIAGDTQAVDEGIVKGSHDRIFDFASVGVGVVGDAGDVQEFRDQLESEIRTERLERRNDIGIEEIARIAARHSRSEHVDAVVAGRDSDGVPRIRQVDSDGAMTETTTVALGSGAQIAYGELETVAPDLEGDEVPGTTRSVVETVMERDTATGGDVDVWVLRGDSEDATGDAGVEEDP